MYVCSKLGYLNVKIIYYRVPKEENAGKDRDTTLEEELHEVQDNDKSCGPLVDLLLKEGEADIYVEHGEEDHSFFGVENPVNVVRRLNILVPVSYNDTEGDGLDAVRISESFGSGHRGESSEGMNRGVSERGEEQDRVPSDSDDEYGGEDNIDEEDDAAEEEDAIEDEDAAEGGSEDRNDGTDDEGSNADSIDEAEHMYHVALGADADHEIGDTVDVDRWVPVHELTDNKDEELQLYRRWFVQVTYHKPNKIWVIRKYPYKKHDCGAENKSRRLTNKVIASYSVDKFGSASQNMRPTQIQEAARNKFRMNGGWWQEKNAKEEINKHFQGNVLQEYVRLQDYLETLKVTNPGSSVYLETEEGSHIFKRLYICFHALKVGFKTGCRRIIWVDGCFLKRYVGGKLLTAVGRDANNQMYPLAWTVVRGLIRAVADLLPYAERRRCVRHIFAKWRKANRGEALQIHFWKCVKATTVQELEELVSDFDEISEQARKDFLEANPKLFCRAFQETWCKSHVVDNNMCEVFNCFIIEARFKAIVSMLEDICRLMMSRIGSKELTVSEERSRWRNQFGSRITHEIERNKEIAANYLVQPNRSGKYECIDGVNVFVVDKNKRECTCRSWELTGIPCAHATAAISHDWDNVEDYASRCRPSSHLRLTPKEADLRQKESGSFGKERVLRGGQKFQGKCSVNCAWNMDTTLSYVEGSSKHNNSKALVEKHIKMLIMGVLLIQSQRPEYENAPSYVLLSQQTTESSSRKRKARIEPEDTAPAAAQSPVRPTRVPVTRSGRFAEVEPHPQQADIVTPVHSSIQSPTCSSAQPVHTEGESWSNNAPPFDSSLPDDNLIDELAVPLEQHVMHPTRQNPQRPSNKGRVRSTTNRRFNFGEGRGVLFSKSGFMVENPGTRSQRIHRVPSSRGRPRMSLTDIMHVERMRAQNTSNVQDNPEEAPKLPVLARNGRRGRGNRGACGRGRGRPAQRGRRGGTTSN
ncbi:hypothetical protein Tsubulata_029702 [Turnera subulata]|uniref:SWIM-type domain-containing protein n=1 Tax=Turnera subulata TaxID=218843 RepID=A0A9Q0G694_9ROSI|nr:hypothetical protein Tsubulata_029702 [Turnera subulata]